MSPTLKVMVRTLSVALLAALLWIACDGPSLKGDVLVAAARGESAESDLDVLLTVMYSGNINGEIEPCG